MTMAFKNHAEELSLHIANEEQQQQQQQRQQQNSCKEEYEWYRKAKV